jgi:hypothetical protein
MAKDATNNMNTSEDFHKTVVAVDNRFVAFVYMVEVCYFLNLFHSGDDVNNETVAFVGDRTESRDPYAVLSTEILPWDWKEFDVSMDATVPEDWYKDTDNGKSCWPVPAIHEKKWFPRMLLLPTVLVTFMVSKKCTPYELHKEIKRCIVEDLHGFADDNCKHLLEWCLAAGQSTSATKCAPVLALKFKPVMTSDSTFAEWCVHRLASTFGPRRVQGTAAAVSIRGSTSITTTQTQSQVTPNDLATQEMVKSVKLMAESVMKMSDKNVKIAEQAAERALKKEATEFTQYMEAVLMGWAGVTAKQSIPRLWIKFLTSKKDGQSQAQSTSPHEGARQTKGDGVRAKLLFP